jgi:hypothetical protein
VIIELGREIYASSNGDHWHLLYDPVTGHSFVRHSANPASGGHITDIGLPAFLANGRGGPEHQALWRMIASLSEGKPTPTAGVT